MKSRSSPPSPAAEDYLERYGRQLILPEIGAAGQAKLADASVLLLGAGGLGSSAALYLAAAGVGRLGLVDDERVELSNLHRQILYTTEDLGASKPETAAKRLAALNPDARLVPIAERVAADNADRLFAQHDLILDGSDNVATRFLANDACVRLRKPLIHGAAVGWRGQLMVIRPGDGPCLRCLFPEPPSAGDVPRCREAGVLGPLVGIVGSFMAAEAIKLIVGRGAPLVGRLLTIDGLECCVREVPVRRASDCLVCGPGDMVGLKKALPASDCH